MVGVDIFDYRIIKSANGTIVVEVSNFVRKNNIYIHIHHAYTLYITDFLSSCISLNQISFNWFINDLFHFPYNYSFTHEGSSGTRLKMKIVSGSSHFSCCKLLL